MSEIAAELRRKHECWALGQKGPKILLDAADEIDDLVKANQILQTLIGNRDKEVDRLRKGIQDYLDGNYVNPRKFRAGMAGKCAHGQYWFEDCGECIDFHFADLLTPSTPSPALQTPIENKGGGQ